MNGAASLPSLFCSPLALFCSTLGEQFLQVLCALVAPATHAAQAARWSPSPPPHRPDPITAEQNEGRWHPIASPPPELWREQLASQQLVWWAWVLGRSSFPGLGVSLPRPQARHPLQPSLGNLVAERSSAKIREHWSGLTKHMLPPLLPGVPLGELIIIIRQLGRRQLKLGS